MVGEQSQAREVDGGILTKRKRVFVFGWYGHGNVGDEAFKDAFVALWPEIDFTFGDRVPLPLTGYDGLWFGGGSFLDQSPQMATIDEKIFPIPPISFIGVGVGDSIHPMYYALLRRAKIVVVRDRDSADRLKGIVRSDLVHTAGDIVFARTIRKAKPIPKRALVILNEHLAPKGDTAEWSAHAWTLFCLEMAKACDKLATIGWKFDFVPMCSTQEIDDRRAAAAVVGRMKQARLAHWSLEPAHEHRLLKEIGQSSLVITQRFHGAVLARMSGVPCIILPAHDKLWGLVKDGGFNFVPYFGFTEKAMLEVVSIAMGSSHLSYAEDIKKSWLALSPIVENASFSSPTAKP